MTKKKKGFNWKKLGKRWAKAQNWMGSHVNPDVLSGHEERIFGGDDFGFGFNPPSKKRK